MAGMRIGYKLATEGFGPAELIRQAVLAEQAGFDFVEMSDHCHPWVEAQRHSAFSGREGAWLPVAG